MKKLRALIVTTAFIVLGCANGYATEIALTASEHALVDLAVEKMQIVATRAKKAGMTRDQIAALIANTVHTDLQLSSGVITETHRKVLLSAATIFFVAYVVASCCQGTVAFWEWKWSGKQESPMPQQRTMNAEQQAALEFLKTGVYNATPKLLDASVDAAKIAEPDNPAVTLE